MSPWPCAIGGEPVVTVNVLKIEETPKGTLYFHEGSCKVGKNPTYPEIGGKAFASKFERLVKHIKAENRKRGTSYNPWAVATAALGGHPPRRNPYGRKWIKGAIRRPGALTAYAKRHGTLTARGTIDIPRTREVAERAGDTRVLHELALAETLRGFQARRNPSPVRGRIYGRGHEEADTEAMSREDAVKQWWEEEGSPEDAARSYGPQWRAQMEARVSELMEYGPEGEPDRNPSRARKFIGKAKKALGSRTARRIAGAGVAAAGIAASPEVGPEAGAAGMALGKRIASSGVKRNPSPKEAERSLKLAFKELQKGSMSRGFAREYAERALRQSGDEGSVAVAARQLLAQLAPPPQRNPKVDGAEAVEITYREANGQLWTHKFGEQTGITPTLRVRKGKRRDSLVINSGVTKVTKRGIID